MTTTPGSKRPLADRPAAMPHACTDIPRLLATIEQRDRQLAEARELIRELTERVEAQGEALARYRAGQAGSCGLRGEP